MPSTMPNYNYAVGVAEDKLYPITPEEYQELQSVLQTLREARYLGVEEFRLWAKVRHTEVETVEDALRMCTPKELEEAVYAIMPSECWDSPLYNELLHRMRIRLEERQAHRGAELAKAGPGEAVMPDA